MNMDELFKQIDEAFAKEEKEKEKMENDRPQD